MRTPVAGVNPIRQSDARFATRTSFWLPITFHYRKPGGGSGEGVETVPMVIVLPPDDAPDHRLGERLSDKEQDTEQDAGSGTALTTLGQQAREYAAQARSVNTRRAYRADWDDFTRWCNLRGVSPLPATPETVALYLTACAEGLKPSTLQRRLASISQAHQAAGHETPTQSAAVRLVWAGIRRAKGVAQQGKAPAVTAEVRRMVEALETREAKNPLLSVRDRALLLVGFAGAFRRSELVGLDAADAVLTGEGVTVTVRRGKTDQEGVGRKVGLPYGSRPHTCPVRALLAWKASSGIAEGPLFRGVDRHGNLQNARLSDRAVALVVKRAAEAAGLDPAQYAGHSLRAGLATSAAMAGASERAIMAQTGHKSVTVARRYIRDGSLYRENAAGQVGL